MNHEDFWKLIDKTRLASDGDGEKQAEMLVSELTYLPEAEIIRFDEIFHEYFDRAYHRDLWAAAYIINCGCSDDGFMDFRAWLIGQGLAAFENALNNPESLVDFVTTDTLTQVEVLNYVAYQAYMAKTGEEMPITRSVSPDLTSPDLAGDEWDEDKVDQKYPKLYARFGDCAGLLASLKGNNPED